MALTAALLPFGKSYRLDLTGTSATVATTASDNKQGQQYVISNVGSVDGFFTFAAPTDAVPVAVAPIVGTPANGVCIAAGSIQSFNLCAGAQIAGITLGGSTTIYITVGEGL